MKQIYKRLGAVLLALCMLFSLMPTVFASTSRLELTIGSTTFSVNGVTKSIDAEGSKAEIVDSCTMLPITGIVTALGGTTQWDATTRQVTILLGDQSVRVGVADKDSTAASVAYVTTAGVTKTEGMQKPPYIENGRTLVHIRVLEFFEGISVSWDAVNSKVIVSYTQQDTMTLRITNNTGNTITELHATDSAYTNDSGNLLSTSLPNGQMMSVELPVQDTVSTYTLHAQMGETTYAMYTGLNITGAKDYISVVLNSKTGDMDYTADGVVQVHSSEFTFLNKSGVTIEELYVGTTSSASTLDNGENLLSGDVDDDDDATFDIDLSDYTSWYFLAVDEDNEQYVGKVTFADTEADELYLKLTGAGNNKFAEYDPDAVGDLTVAIVNNTGVDIEGMFLLEEGEGKDWDDYISDADDEDEGDDYDALEGYYEDEYFIDGSDLDYGETVIVEGMFDAECYDLVIYFDSDYDEYVYIHDIDFEDASEAAVIYLMDDDTYEAEMDSDYYEYFTDDDDMMLFLIENDTGEDLTEVIIDDDTDVDILKDFWSDNPLDDGDSLYYLMEDSTDFDNDLNFLFEITDDDKYGDVDVDDFEDYRPFVKLTITEDDDEAVIDDSDIEDIFNM